MTIKATIEFEFSSWDEYSAFTDRLCEGTYITCGSFEIGDVKEVPE